MLTVIVAARIAIFAIVLSLLLSACGPQVHFSTSAGHNACGGVRCAVILDRVTTTHFGVWPSVKGYDFVEAWWWAHCTSESVHNVTVLTQPSNVRNGLARDPLLWSGRANVASGHERVPLHGSPMVVIAVMAGQFEGPANACHVHVRVIAYARPRAGR